MSKTAVSPGSSLLFRCVQVGSLILLTGLSVLPAWADEAVKTTPGVASGTHLINVLLSLLMVIAVILGLAWLLRRFGQGGFTSQQHMKVVASLAVGARERVVVVDVAGQQLLLGVTPQQIRTLHVFESPVIETSKDLESTDFKSKLMSIMQNKNSGGQ